MNDVAATRRDWSVIRALVAKDWIAVRRSRAVLLPMAIVPVLLLVGLPALIGLLARNANDVNIANLLDSFPPGIVQRLLVLPPQEQLIVLVNEYLLAPLFIIVPLMVASVLAADAFAGEKDRRTLEGLLHLPVSERDLFVAKLIVAYVPAVLISWVGFLGFAIVSNSIAWPVLHRIFIPTRLWLVLIFWVGPAVAALGLGIMVRVSARARTTQEANQLGGAVVLPLVLATVGQTTSGLLVATLGVAMMVGAVVWVVALLLLMRGIQLFTRDRIASRM